MRKLMKRATSVLLSLAVVSLMVVSPVGTQRAKAFGLVPVIIGRIILCIGASVGLSMAMNPDHTTELGMKLEELLSDVGRDIVNRIAESCERDYALSETMFFNMSKSDWTILSSEVAAGINSLTNAEGQLMMNGEVAISSTATTGVFNTQYGYDANYADGDYWLARYKIGSPAGDPITLRSYQDPYEGHPKAEYRMCIYQLKTLSDGRIARIYQHSLVSFDPVSKWSNLVFDGKWYVQESLDNATDVGLCLARDFSVPNGRMALMTFYFKELPGGNYLKVDSSGSNVLGDRVKDVYVDQPILAPLIKHEAFTHDVVLDRWNTLVANDATKDTLPFIFPGAPGAFPLSPDGTILWGPTNTLPKELVQTGDITKPGEDVGEGEIEGEIDIPKTDALKLPAALITKFPFSIPFDLYRGLSVLSVEPITPVFDVPFKYGTLVDYKIRIDFVKFDPVVRLLRVAELLLFSVGLAVATRNLIKW